VFLLSDTDGDIYAEYNYLRSGDYLLYCHDNHLPYLSILLLLSSKEISSVATLQRPVPAHSNAYGLPVIMSRALASPHRSEYPLVLHPRGKIQ
jgi:hypothetical protein